MKNKLFITVFLIFIGAVLLRLWGLDSEGVLWFDEYIGYQSVYTDSLSEIPKSSLINSKQPPLYYWFLWIWMKIFGNSDWTMKFLSLIFGSLAVIAAYFCGKAFANKNTGIIFAILSAISAVGILFSQEVKAYSLIILLSTLLPLSLIKILRDFTNKNLFFLILINLLLLYTHTLAFAFCFFEFLILYIYFYKKDKNNFKKLVFSSIILAIICTPLILDIINILVKNHGKAWGAVWGEFKLVSIFSFINDYISPFLFNLNSYITFNEIFSKPEILILLLLFSFPLIIIYFAGLIKTFKTRTDCRYLSAICILYLTTVIVLHLKGQMMFLPRYGLEILPFLLLFTSYGLTLFNNKFLNAKNLVATVLVLNFLFMFCFPEINAQNLSKTMFPTNFKDLSKTLKNQEFQPDDIFIIFYYGSTTRFIAAPKYYDFSSYDTYIFDNCGWETTNSKKCLSNRKLTFKELLETIKTGTPTGKNIIITIPSDIFDFYEETINRVNLEKKYPSYKKLDENNWVTLIYSNR